MKYKVNLFVGTDDSIWMDARQWCIDEFGVGLTFNPSGRWRAGSFDSNNIEFEFCRDEDAMAFKLRWL